MGPAPTKSQVQKEANKKRTSIEHFWKKAQNKRGN